MMANTIKKFWRCDVTHEKKQRSYFLPIRPHTLMLIFACVFIRARAYIYIYIYIYIYREREREGERENTHTESQLLHLYILVKSSWRNYPVLQVTTTRHA